MKNSYANLVLSFFFIGMLSGAGFLFGVSQYGWMGTAEAANASVELALQSYSDVSMFYDAMVNTGVLASLDPNQHYTIFAPVNAAFREVPPQSYPCFYSAECRPGIGGLLRDHIVVGRHEVSDLVTYDGGIQTNGRRLIHVEEPFIGDYTADGRKILSKTEIDGNIVYRVDGFLASRQQLSQFQTVSYVPASGTVTTRKTVVKTYTAPMVEPAETDVSSSAYGPEGEDEVETITHRTTGPLQ